MNVRIEYKPKLQRYGPRDTKSDKILRSISAPRYFTELEYDRVLELCSQYGFWIETIGD